MNKAERVAWPKTPDGVTDWETVFEDPQIGFIPLIMHAHTPHALKECATIVVQKLFIRADDGMQVMRYIIDIDGFIPDTAEHESDPAIVEGMKGKTADLLRQIKDDRISKAEAYLEKKKREGERREE